MLPVVSQTENNKNYSKEFEVFSELYGGAFPVLRKQAMEAFMKCGFPGAKDEEYKYLHLAPVTGTDFSVANPSLKSQISRDEITRYAASGGDALLLVFVNGHFRKDLSSDDTLVCELIAGSTLDLSGENHFGKSAELSGQAFNALNTAFFSECAYIRIPDNMQTERAIHLLHITGTGTEKISSFPRNLIIAGKNSKAQVLATYQSQNEEQFTFCNAVTEVFLDENAFVELDIRQNENDQALHISNVYATQKKNSTFDITTVTLGGKLVRNNLTISLTENNCSAHLYGLTIAGKNQVVDHHTVVDHQSPYCQSNQLYKNILDDHAQGIFNGKIFVRKDAQKTNAFQSSKNILLSDHAVMNAKPQLEIFADDVKCSHGATTGQLDEEALFYLRARGIGEKDARALLNFAFASDVTEKINNESLKKNLLQVLAGKLHSQIEFDLN